MTAKELSAYVNGKTLEMGARSSGQIHGTTLIDREGVGGVDSSYESLSGIPDGSVDAIVSDRGLETVNDPLKTLREWNRVLREGGKLAVICADGTRGPAASDEGRQTYTPKYLANLLRLVGGWHVTESRLLADASSFLLVAERQGVCTIRGPLGSLSATLALAASENDANRAELYFQLGTILLQSGDPTLAERCFKTMLQLEPGNADGLFGLGMCYGTQHLWPEALTELQRVVALDPTNLEAKRWVALAKEKVGGTAKPGVQPVLA